MDVIGWERPVTTDWLTAPWAHLASPSQHLSDHPGPGGSLPRDSILASAKVLSELEETWSVMSVPHETLGASNATLGCKTGLGLHMVSQELGHPVMDSLTGQPVTTAVTLSHLSHQVSPKGSQ